jgi:hypothetical protein
MKYKEKAERLKEIIYRANGCYLEPRTQNLRWNSRDDFENYIMSIGCNLKENKKRRSGFIVTPYLYDRVCAEIPIDLAEKILVLGDLP